MVSLRDPLRDAAAVTRGSRRASSSACSGSPRVRLVDFQRSPAPAAELRAAARRHRPLDAAHRLRQRPGHERRQGEPARRAAGRGDHACSSSCSSRATSPTAGRCCASLSRAAPRRRRPLRLRRAAPRLRAAGPGRDGAACWCSSSCRRTSGPALVLACVFLAHVRRGAPPRHDGRRRPRCCCSPASWPATCSASRTPSCSASQMWMSPWDNVVRGGDQIAHALWALASGAVSGTGLGLGDPRLVPAGHTDLMLAVVGEELGFVGIAAVFVLFGLVAWRCTAHRAAGARRLHVLPGARPHARPRALQLVLIAAGLLGLMPLTGVATPFLSYGRSSMIANLFAHRDRARHRRARAGGRPGEAGVRAAGAGAGRRSAARSCSSSLGRAAIVQVRPRRPDPRRTGAERCRPTASGASSYNPRLLAAAQQIERGTIFDRNGIPLATSRPAISPASAEDAARGWASRADTGAAWTADARCYPFGGLTYHLLGDFRSAGELGGTQHVVRRARQRRAGCAATTTTRAWWR